MANGYTKSAKSCREINLELSWLHTKESTVIRGVDSANLNAVLEYACKVKGDGACLIPAMRPDGSHSHMVLLDIDCPVNEDLYDRILWWPHTVAIQRSCSGQGVHVIASVAPVFKDADPAATHNKLWPATVSAFGCAFPGAKVDPAASDITRRAYVSEYPFAYGTGEPLLATLVAAPAGQRHNTFRDLAWTLTSRGLDSATVLEVLRAGNTQRADALPDDELKRMVGGYTDALEAHLTEPDQREPNPLLEHMTELDKQFSEQGGWAPMAGPEPDSMVGPVPTRAPLVLPSMPVASSIEELADFLSIVGTRVRINLDNDALEIQPLSDGKWQAPNRSQQLGYTDTIMAKHGIKWSTRGSVGVVPSEISLRGLYMLAQRNAVSAMVDALETFLKTAPEAAGDEVVLAGVETAWQADPALHPELVDAFDKAYTSIAMQLLARRANLEILPTFCIILVGPQGCGKTAYAEEILPAAFKAFRAVLTADNLKDAAQQVAGTLVLEYAEVAARARATLSRGELRQLVTEGHITTVPKYNRTPVTIRNTALIIATSNPDGNPLLDSVGGRRQCAVNYPFRMSVADSLEAGKLAGDWLRANNASMLVRGLAQAQALLDADICTVMLDSEYETARLAQQHRASVSGDDADAVRALVTIAGNLDGWQESVLKPEERVVAYDADGGGANPTILRRLIQHLCGYNLSSQQINRQLSSLPGVAIAQTASRKHRRQGQQIQSSETFRQLAEQAGLADAICDQATKYPALFEPPVAGPDIYEWVREGSQ